MLSVTKIFEFCYGHWLPNYDGKCANLHGHNCVLEVEVTKSDSIVTSYQSMIIDFGDLKASVTSLVIDKIDHKCLNDIAGLEIPTAENMVLWIVKKLSPVFGDGLIRVRVYETSNSYAEWKL